MKEKIVSLNENENGIVKKAQQLVESRYTLTPMEIKIVSELITMVNEMELKRKDIYEAFENVARDLMSKPLTIRSTDNESWLVVNWVSSARYIKGSGTVIFKISDELKPYLLALKKHFLQYDIKNILPLRSTYVIRLYELLKDWFNIEFRYSKSKIITKVIDLRWLRQTFQISNKYKYNDIKRRILLKAQSDLPKYTDIKFKFNEIKEGHKVTHIKFFIQGNQKIDKTKVKQQPVKQIEDQRAKLLIELLPKQYRVPAAEKLLRRYTHKGSKYITAQIEYVNKSTPQNYFAYLTSALENDYASGDGANNDTNQDRALMEQKTKKEKQKQAAEVEKRQQEEEEIKMIDNFYSSLSEEEQNQIKNEALIMLHKKYPRARPTSAKFGDLSIEIAVRKILREKIKKDNLDKA